MRTEDFIAQGSSQIESLQQWLDDTTRAIEKCHTDMAEYRELRQQALNELSVELLRDLKPETITRLQREWNFALESSWPQAEMARRRAEISARLAELSSFADADWYEGERLQREVRADAARKDLSEIETGYRPMLETKGLESLINRDYEGPGYQARFWQPEFYRDWKRADEIVAELDYESWSKLRDVFMQLREGYLAAKAASDEAAAQLQQLEQNRQQYLNLNAALGSVENDVLELCRTRLRAQLDLASREHPRLRELSRIEAAMSELEEKISHELQPLRSRIHDQMIALQQILARARRSRQDSVPDDYARVVTQRPVHSYRDSSPAVIHHYHENYYWLDTSTRDELSGWFGAAESQSYSSDTSSGVTESSYGYIS
ncbi:MAG: hypothetical protein U0Z53_20970 [Blastocatellia bacterium]